MLSTHHLLATNNQKYITTQLMHMLLKHYNVCSYIATVAMCNNNNVLNLVGIIEIITINRDC